MDETKIAPNLLEKLQPSPIDKGEVAPSIPVIIRYDPEAVRPQAVKPPQMDLVEPEAKAP